MKNNQSLQYSIPDSLIITIRDHVNQEFPLRVPFHIDEGTTKITTAKLHYTVERISENTGKPISFTVLKDFIRIFIDGQECTSIDDIQGSLDLTKWITAPGWHEVVIYSNSFIRVAGQLCVRSYVNA